MQIGCQRVQRHDSISHSPVSSRASRTVCKKYRQQSIVLRRPRARERLSRSGSRRVRSHGQIAFFAEFLATAGVFDRWVDACPLSYSSPNASRPRDVLGTLMLGILAGSKRYAYIAGVRGDAVAAQALGLKGLVSEDSVRRALKAMVLAATEPWMREALMHTAYRACQGRHWSCRG